MLGLCWGNVVPMFGYLVGYMGLREVLLTGQGFLNRKLFGWEIIFGLVEGYVGPMLRHLGPRTACSFWP